MIKAEEIIKTLSEAQGPLRLQDISRRLKCHRDDQHDLKQILKKLDRSGEIERVRGSRFVLARQKETVTGRFRAHRDGYGFVIPELQERASSKGDVYIGEGRSLDTLDGDCVLAQIDKVKTDQRCEGRILKVIERARATLVGRYVQERTFGVLIPSERRIQHDFLIPDAQRGGANSGDIVMAEITAYPKKGQVPEAKVLKVLGSESSPAMDTEIVKATYKLNADFSDAVLFEAEKKTQEPLSKIVPGRVDLRDLPTVTIDGEKARDFDDAISIQQKREGFTLWIHIADVAHYVDADSALDQEAAQRGTSVYFPDAVIPMLPEVLSNDLCSLKPKEDRLTLTLEIDLDAFANVRTHRLHESVICSDERMTYTDVAAILSGEDKALLEQYEPLLPLFKQLERLTQKLKARRFRRGSLDFDLPEADIILSPSGETLDIVRQDKNAAHGLVEECMLLANECIAEALLQQKLPGLFRIHETPTAERITQLNALTRQFSYKIKLDEDLKPKALSGILEAARDQPEEKLIHQIVLRCMQQARYATENKGHFGLASEAYTHFTSPIRRYPDLIVHRLLKQNLKTPLSETEKTPWEKSLPQIARHSSSQERLAVEAEREVIQRKQVQFMCDKVGDVFQGLITGVVSYGLFIKLDRYFVEGLVKVSNMKDDYYEHDPERHALIGRKRKRLYRLGQTIEVRVMSADTEQWQIDFEVVRRKKRREEY